MEDSSDIENPMTRKQKKILAAHYDVIPPAFVEMRSKADGMYDQALSFAWKNDIFLANDTYYRVMQGIGSVKTMYSELTDFYEECDQFFNL